MNAHVTFPTERTVILDQLGTGCAWTAERLARVDTGDLHRPTPCTEFDLGQLIDHLEASMTRFRHVLGAALPAPSADSDHPAERFDRHRRAVLAAWATADLDATYELPIGTLPAPFVAQIMLAEIVIHGWDVSQATGERADAPDALANQVLDFGGTLLSDETRSRAFGPARSGGTSASDRMVAYYGRTPRPPT